MSTDDKTEAALAASAGAVPDDFESWFRGVEEGDGDIPLPTPADRKRWDEYVARHALALGAWKAAMACRPTAVPDEWGAYASWYWRTSWPSAIVRGSEGRRLLPTDFGWHAWQARAALATTPAASQSSAPAQAAWRCFHCDELFTDSEAAELHFGRGEAHQPACTIDIDGYRRMEETVRRYTEEDTDLHREIHRLSCEHQQALQREEEKGYALGLRDARAEASSAPAQTGPSESHRLLGEVAMLKRHDPDKWSSNAGSYWTVNVPAELMRRIDLAVIGVPERDGV